MDIIIGVISEKRLLYQEAVEKKKHKKKQKKL